MKEKICPNCNEFLPDECIFCDYFELGVCSNVYCSIKCKDESWNKFHSVICKTRDVEFHQLCIEYQPFQFAINTLSTFICSCEKGKDTPNALWAYYCNRFASKKLYNQSYSRAFTK